jgi:hypothetical protein
MSDKIFGTYGDATTLKQQFESCSYGDFTVTNDYGFNLGDTVEKAPGVIEVEIGISLVTSTRNQIQELSDCVVCCNNCCTYLLFESSSHL